MADERTANNAEMTANQQAYNTDGAKNEKGDYIVENGERVHVGGAKIVSIKEDGDREIVKEASQVTSNKIIDKTLIRTDVDSHQEFQTSKLQNQSEGSNKVGYKDSSLNITAYNVYEGDGSQATKPSSVIVGVAGSSGDDAGITGGSNNAPDWQQNYNISLNRSTYNKDNLSDDVLRGMRRIKTTVCDYSSGYPTNCKDVEIDNPDWANVQYEIDMREKVRELKKYQDKNVPIILVGDSKGGEDAAYLALKSEQSGIPIDHLYLTNPKGIRLDGEEGKENTDYGRLCKMAQEGKITVEIVYPEVVSDGYPVGSTKFKSDGSGICDGREIPGKRIYTVPNGLNTTENHTISNYEKDVYQGPYNNYKFQCDEKPEEILKKHSIAGLRPSSYEKCIGYRYKVSRITDRSGKTISVTDYFFDEQIDLLKSGVQARIIELQNDLGNLQKEDISAYFHEKTVAMRSTFETKHEELIKNATPFSTYKNDHNSRFDGVTDSELIKAIEEELKVEYNNELQKHVDVEGDRYPAAVLGVVSGFIASYKETVSAREQQLKSEVEKLERTIEDIKKAKEEHKKSQKEIQLTIEKMK